MKPLPELKVMPRVRRDIARSREFLRQNPNARPMRRIREIFQAIRLLRHNPELNAVRRTDPERGLSFRRHNVGQFAIVYVYFKPSANLPKGLLYIRAICHASEEHGVLRVREECPSETRRLGNATMGATLAVTLRQWATREALDGAKDDGWSFRKMTFRLDARPC